MFTIKDAGKYSVTPHELGFCGPAENCSEVLLKGSDREIKKVLEKFPAVIFYTKQIAKANNIEDYLREDVLEAYWLGNDLLNKAQYENGGYPHHSYHVWQDEPFNKKIALTEKMKALCQVTVKDNYSYHWKKRVQKLDKMQLINLRHYNKINRCLKES